MLLSVEETLLIAGEENFATVRHLVVQGTNYEIGKHLASVAKARYDLHLSFGTNSTINQVRRLYFPRNYPIHLERARGVAAAYGCPFEEDTFDPTTLLYAFPGTGVGGCSVVYYPPKGP